MIANQNRAMKIIPRAVDHDSSVVNGPWYARGVGGAAARRKRLNTDGHA